MEQSPAQTPSSLPSPSPFPSPPPVSPLPSSLPSSKKTKSSARQNGRLPTAQEVISHYVEKGLDTKEASEKAIDDLQKALYRAVTSNSGGNDSRFLTETSRKLDLIGSRLVNLDMKLDSKPGYKGMLAIGVASGAALRGFESLLPHVAHAIGSAWNAVCSTTSNKP